MADRKIEALSKVPLFARCSHKDLEFLASETDEVDVEAGRAVIRQGVPSDGFFVVLEGELDVTKDGRPQATMGAGDFFGEISMLDRGDATATVTARTPAHLAVMSHSQFKDAIKANDALLVQVLAEVAIRLRQDERARAAQT